MPNIYPNAKYNELAGLYKTYLNCVDGQLTNYLNSSEQAAGEWCGAEKTAYLEFMKVNYKTQYENLIRLENLNFWFLFYRGIQ